MFEDLDQRSLEAIANAAVEQRYETGQEIVRQGDTGVGACIIRSGKVDIVQDREGKEQKIATLGPGDVFGEMALLDEFPRSATARAVEPTTALGIQRWHFRGILESHPQIALALLPMLTRRIRNAEGRSPEAARHERLGANSYELAWSFRVEVSRTHDRGPRRSSCAPRSSSRVRPTRCGVWRHRRGALRRCARSAYHSDPVTAADPVRMRAAPRTEMCGHATRRAG